MNSLKIFSFLGATLLVLISYQNCAKLEARKFDSSIFDDSDDLIDGDQPNLPPVNEPPQPLPPYTEPNRPLEDDANLVVISSGHNFTEGVAYHGPSKTLFFSDLSNGNDRVFSLDLVSGASEVWLQQNFGSNGNIFDKNGRMYSAQSRDQRRIVRYDDLSSSANSIPLPNMVGAEGFNAPNDVELHSNGDLYFTDPTYNGVTNSCFLILRPISKAVAPSTELMWIWRVTFIYLVLREFESCLHKALCWLKSLWVKPQPIAPLAIPPFIYQVDLMFTLLILEYPSVLSGKAQILCQLFTEEYIEIHVTKVCTEYR